MTKNPPLTASNVYAALSDRCLPLIKHYHADLLEHDRKAIEANPACPFLHWTTECGTHLTFLPPADDESYPPRGEYVPFLFGTATREHLLDAVVTMAAYHAKEKPSACCYYYDGKRLRFISADDAVAVAKEYRRRIESEWNRSR